MKKWLLALALPLALLFGATPAQAIDVFIDGKPLQSDVPPQIMSGRTMVPMRAIFEGLNARVDFELSQDKRSANIWAHKNKRTIGLTMDMTTGQGWPVAYVVDESTGSKKESNLYLDAPPYLSDSRTMVPLRFIAESLGANVDYENGIVRIVTSGTGQVDEKYTSVLEGGTPARLSAEDSRLLGRALNEYYAFWENEDKRMDFFEFVMQQPIEDRAEGFRILSEGYLLNLGYWPAISEAAYSVANPELKEALVDTEKVLDLYCDACAKGYGRAIYNGTVPDYDSDMMIARLRLLSKSGKVLDAYTPQAL
ncbi:copper amine oxidase N-terminal domain-containing protein [Peptococcus simiae]|uniref:Copper amine oxidase N-terminal domain-containing protein n=1 Tax=Peptococcus simiae TaxID=1643805 RepID=A0ABW9GXC9_9FIRM